MVFGGNWRFLTVAGGLVFFGGNWWFLVGTGGFWRSAISKIVFCSFFNSKLLTFDSFHFFQPFIGFFFTKDSN